MASTAFVNNYCPSFANLRIDEDRYRTAVGCPAGFRSDDSLSRTLSHVLRHGAAREGFTLLPGGFLNVADILSHRRFRDKCTEDDLKRIVAQDAKGRYLLRADPHTGALQIRANQGHTIPVQDDGTLLTKITRDDAITEATHGTNPSAWCSIQKAGLSRMKRNHIHMVPGLADGDDPRLPGLRERSAILIVIDVHRAMFDEIEFFRSRNNVLLSPGNARGFIAPKYFKRVVDRRTGRDLLAERHL